MDGQNDGGETQQKDDSSKRHTYPLIRVRNIISPLAYIYLFNILKELRYAR